MYIPSWFPGAQWKRDGLKWGKMVREMMARPYEKVEAEEVRLRTFAPGMRTRL